MTYSGSCLCGRVRFSVLGPLRPVIGCHCAQCRKTSGHFVAATAAARDGLQIRGDVTWYQSSASARRGFCGICGSSLFWDDPESSHISIHAGVFDGPIGQRIAGHIFVDDKGDYYDLDPDLPQAPGYDPNLTTRVK